MKRIVPSIAIALIAIILVSDIGLIIKYQQNPDAYSVLENVSFIHFLALNEWGIQVAYGKVILSILLMVSWCTKIASPTEVSTLRYLTIVYALTWSLIGLLVLTGIVGILQYASGLQIRLYDFSPLLASMGLSNLAKLTFGVVCLPLMLMGVPHLHNKLLKIDNKALQPGPATPSS